MVLTDLQHYRQYKDVSIHISGMDGACPNTTKRFPSKDITIKNKTVYLKIYRYCSKKKVEKKKLAHSQMLAVSLSSRSMDLLKADIQKNILKPFKAVLSVLSFP